MESQERITADILRERFGLTVKSEFIPFTESRNRNNVKGKGPDGMSLNWRVTLVKERAKPCRTCLASDPCRHADVEILTTDYSAGIGHCPAYKNKRNHVGAAGFGGLNLIGAEAITRECETGKVAIGDSFFWRTGATIEPDAADVLYSLVSDSSVLDSGGFEDWASELGYDTDSRKAEETYRARLEIALKLRAALGEAKLSELREAFQDF